MEEELPPPYVSEAEPYLGRNRGPRSSSLVVKSLLIANRGEIACPQFGVFRM
jgi:hypothetical protein